MKIALYLQNLIKTEGAERKFYEKMEQVKQAQVDLLVFPENTYTPFSNTLREKSLWQYDHLDSQVDEIEEYVKGIARLAGCPIIFCDQDCEGVIYSLYYNESAKRGETITKSYYKHVATSNSAFDLNDYERELEDIFEPIYLKNMKIGHLICYDSSFSLFSRMYGKNEVDVIINSSGGHVDYKKWSYYQKVRALENQCYTLCVMANHDEFAKNESCVLGYDPCGRELEFILLGKGKTNNLKGKDGIYIVEISNPAIEQLKIVNGQAVGDQYLMQTATENRNIDFWLHPKQVLGYSEKIAEEIYWLFEEGKNIIFIHLRDKNILEPEKVEKLLYHPTLKAIPNKRYVILNEWENLSFEYYQTVLSNVLKVRAAENYCAVVLNSNIIEMCYQVGRNKNIQVLLQGEEGFGLDFTRMTGPEALWKTKTMPNMRASWRSGYEALIKQIYQKV